MKIFFLAATLAFISLGFAQRKQPATHGAAIQTMVETELAFAKRAADEGVRPAFLAFIADDGILFRPIAVKGKQWMTEHPVPPSDKHPLLSWYPSVADMSLAGDMGYTTGPWEFRADAKDANAVAWGNFLTVWKRQPDKSFKFAIDLGISNPKPEQSAPAWQRVANEIKYTGGVGPLRNKETGVALTAYERELSGASETRGAQVAFEEVASKNVRLFRNGQQPIVGKANAVSALRDVAKWSWEPAFADVSQSGDLGYSYGTYELKKTNSNAAEPIERGNYYRIWKLQTDITQGTKWKVVTDLLDPVAEPKKN